MNLLSFVLILFPLLTTTQILTVPTHKNLSELINNPNPLLSQNELAALTLLQQAHPQLSSFQVDNITLAINSTNSTNSTFLDYEVVLTDPNNTKNIYSVVSLTTDHAIEIVSYTQTPIISSDSISKQATNSNSTQGVTNSQNLPLQAIFNTTSTNNTKKSSQNYWTPPLPDILPPGAYRPFRSFDSPIFNSAMATLFAIHPNLNNFRLIDVMYQVVGGIIYRIQYISNDQMIAVKAQIYVNLANVTKIQFFSIECGPKADGCKKEQAQRVYLVQETVILQHPQLVGYQIISVIEEKISSKQIGYLLTFENSSLQLKSLAEVRVNQNNITIDQYYTYSTKI